eukprot:TRINITY_DN43146_c0_g1_i1.p1 TRINITY_DN43146_c0_g1~~TRINITY_DN43146_c0_g1_i1.p1  ORF type:complete len:559 (-),score=67.76 TRINITY_DN43146_c0_g1_i1:117-1709(-)
MVDESKKSRRSWIHYQCCSFGQVTALIRSWYTRVLLLLVAMCLHADQNLAAPNLSAIAEEFELTPLEKDAKLGGQVQLGFFFIGGATSLIMGPLADRLNRVNLLLGVVILGALPCLLINLIPSGRNGFYWYLFSRVLTGVSVGGSFPLLYSLCGDLCPPEQRAMISAAMGVVTGIGVASGQLLAGFLGPRYGWRIPFILVAYPAIFFALLLWATVQDPRRSASKVSPQTQGIELSSGASSSHDAYKAEHPVVGELQDCEVQQRGSSFHHAPGSPSKTSELASSDSIDGHGSVTDCGRFRLVWRCWTNRLLLCSAVPGCVAWSTVATFVPDYLHTEQGFSVQSATLLVSCFGISSLVWAIGGATVGQWVYKRNRAYLSYLIASCTAFAVVPFWLLINTSPESLHAEGLTADTGFRETTGQGLPSLWALAIVVLGGSAAVANPNVKGLLMNVNTSATRGTIFALVTLTDDVGKGLGPEFVAIGVALLGRQLALSLAMSSWFLTAIFLFMTRWTVAKDTQRIERLEKACDSTI